MSKRRTRSENAGFAAALRYLLVRHEYQEDREYADEAGVSPSQVSRYSSGKVDPRPATRENLVSVLDVSVADLELFARLLDMIYEEVVIRDHGEVAGVLSLLEVAPASGEVRLAVIDGVAPLSEAERAEVVRFLHFLQQKRPL
jgi:transcriptional regulator with XRE-family HTH domain